MLGKINRVSQACSEHFGVSRAKDPSKCHIPVVCNIATVQLWIKCDFICASSRSFKWFDDIVERGAWTVSGGLNFELNFIVLRRLS